VNMTEIAKITDIAKIRPPGHL